MSELPSLNDKLEKFLEHLQADNVDADKYASKSPLFSKMSARITHQLPFIIFKIPTDLHLQSSPLPSRKVTLSVLIRLVHLGVSDSNVRLRMEIHSYHNFTPHRNLTLSIYIVKAINPLPNQIISPPSKQ